jgi:hypothetical protein
VKVDEDRVMKMPSRRSLLGLAWAVVREKVKLPAAVVAEEGKETLPAGELGRLSSDFEMPQVPMSVESKAVDQGREEEQIEFSCVRETARHVGTVVQRWLQRMAEDELRGWSTKRLEKLEETFASELERKGVQPSDIKMAVGLVKTALVNTIGDAKGKWILGPHAESWTEYRFRTHDGRRLVADRRIREKSGEHWIVDFKTSKHEGGNVQEFLEREKERYRG